MNAALTLAGYVGLLLFAAARLRRAGWVDRAPLLGLAAWCALSTGLVLAIGLSGVVLMVPTLAWTPDLAMLFRACALELRAQYNAPGGGLAGMIGQVAVAAVVVRLVHQVGAAQLSAVRHRRRQRNLLALVARRDTGLDALIVDHDVAAAYCLPGRWRQVVLTSAALDALDDEQVRAVLAHERAHLRGRHHLILALVIGVQRALPFLYVLRHAREEVTRLVEIAADDAASRDHPRHTIAWALVTLAEAASPPAALAAGGPTTVARIRRLLAPPRPLGALRTAAGSAAVVLLVMAPIVMAVTPGVIAVVTTYCPYPFANHPMPPP